MSAKQAISAAVIVHAGCVLLVRRRVAEGSLSWQFPAGGIEAPESPEDAAVREAYEETGLVVAARRLIGERVHPATKRQLYYVQCDVIAGNASVGDPEELDAVSWVTLAEIGLYVPGGLFAPVQGHLESVMT